MPRRVDVEDEWDDGEDDSESGEEDIDDPPDEDDDTVPCPYCRRPIHEEAQRCPYCENYISEEDKPPQRQPWWFVVGFLLCLLIVFLWITRG